MKKSSNVRKKLELGRHTVRNLERRELAPVAGGWSGVLCGTETGISASCQTCNSIRTICP